MVSLVYLAVAWFLPVSSPKRDTLAGDLGGLWPTTSAENLLDLATVEVNRLFLANPPKQERKQESATVRMTGRVVR